MKAQPNDIPQTTAAHRAAGLVELGSRGRNTTLADVIIGIKSCARGDTICPRPSSPEGAPAPRAPPSRRNVAVVSHAQYVLTVTAAPASRVKASVSKAAW